MRFAFPIIALFFAILSGQFAGPSQPSAQPPIVEYIDDAKSTSTGPGFVVKPSSDSECKCANCNCDELEKRVAALEAKLANPKPASTPVATNGLPPGAVVISERVVSSQPTATYRTMQPAQPVRNVVRGVANGTCRIVNGVRVCN
jgi:hypothetical protein